MDLDNAHIGNAHAISRFAGNVAKIRNSEYAGRMETGGHIPVLPEAVMSLLSPREGDMAIDCTVGRGGHTALFASIVGSEGQVIGFDLDPENLEFTSEKLKQEHAQVLFTPVHANFVEMPDRLIEMRVSADVVLADLGFSSSQMDDPGRGFSFREDGPLDMRLNPEQTTTAADLVASLPEKELADLIYQYGEEPKSRVIARKLVQKRSERPIESTALLAELVREAYGSRARKSRMHPATRTFMALRIAVNDELNSLRLLLESIDRETVRIAESGTDGWLKRGARVGIISFHSLEDRMVKRAFVSLVKRGVAKKLTKKPVVAGEAEVSHNPRARSAKLRVIQVTCD